MRCEIGKYVFVCVRARVCVSAHMPVRVKVLVWVCLERSGSSL